MDLRDMRYIVSIAELGSMTRAAESLHLSQSTLSLALRALERELGVRLFEKKGRNLVLTDSGRMFCAEAKDVLARADALYDRMKGISAEEKKRLRLCTDAVDFSDEAAELYEAAFPDIRIEQIRTDAAGAIEALRRGTADLALTLYAYSDDSVRSELLLEEPMYVVFPNESPLASLDRIPLAGLKDLPLITQPEGFSLHNLTREVFRTAGPGPRQIVQVTDPETIVIQVVKRNGFSLIPESTYRTQILRKGQFIGYVQARPAEEEHCRRQVFLASRRDTVFSEAARAFADYLRDFGTLTRRGRCFPDETSFLVSGRYRLKPV